MITRLLVSFIIIFNQITSIFFYIISTRLPVFVLYNDNQISCILHIFIIDKNFTNYVKIYEQSKNDF